MSSFRRVNSPRVAKNKTQRQSTVTGIPICVLYSPAAFISVSNRLFVEREMSFDIVTRSPTPCLLGDDGKERVRENGAEAKDRLNESMSSTDREKKKRWGKAQADSKFREDLERQKYVFYLYIIDYAL